MAFELLLFLRCLIAMPRQKYFPKISENDLSEKYLDFAYSINRSLSQVSRKGSETSETSAVAALSGHKNSHKKWQLSYCDKFFVSFSNQRL